MKVRLILGCVCVLLLSPAMAQVPVAELAQPPPDARHYVIQSTGGKHGDSWSWVAADGTRMARESLDVRGQIWEEDYSGTPGADGLPVAMTIRGVAPEGDAAESFRIEGGIAKWRSPVDSGSAAYSGHAFYASQGGPIDTTAWFLDRLLASPNRTLELLPGGKAHAELLTSLEVGGVGAERKTVRLWAVSGINNSPAPIWADANDHFFGLAVGIAWLPEAYAGEQKRMEDAQATAMAAQTAGYARSLPKVPTGAVAFVNVRMFDADQLRFLPGQTVVIDKGLIAAVGPAAQLKVPAGAQRIDGHGMTLMPGLW
ncbi:MAG TPA: hypothetical protein VK505_02305, partial [Steroidobacteraceae bacterium]|nr:hypothetical protein [Steroidobacteraceae bacterium]